MSKNHPISEKKELFGLPLEFCPVCDCERVVSQDRTFCLTCGTVFTAYSVNKSKETKEEVSK